jgi:hypothetical protein
MRTYKLYFSNGKSQLIKAENRERAWDVSKWYEDDFGTWPDKKPYRVIYIQYYHT